MPLQGSLKEMSLANLIQVNCQEVRSAHLTLEHAGQVGEVYFADGQVAHAIFGNLTGESAVYEMLTWHDGAFTLDRDRPTPTKTISVPWKSLLLEGMKRSAERAIPKSKKETPPKPNATVAQLKAVDGVTGVVISASDGIVLSADIPGSDGEGEAAVSVFISAAAAQLSEVLQLGEFSHGVVALKNKRLLVLQKTDRCVGLVLSETTSPAIVSNAANQVFK